MWATIRQAFSLIDASRRKPFALVVLGSIAVSFLEIASAALIFVLLQLVLDPGQIPELPVIGDPTALFPGLEYAQMVQLFAAGFGVFFVIRSAAFLFQQYAMSRVVEHTGVILTGRLAEGYLSMPYSFHLTRNSSQLMRNTFDNVNTVTNSVFNTVATVLSETVLVIAMLGVLLVASPGATIVVAGLMLGAVLITFRIVQPRLRVLGKDRQVAATRSIQAMQQAFGGVRDITILGRQRFFMNEIREGRFDMARPTYMRASLAYVPRVALEFVFLGFVMVVLVVAVTSGQGDQVLSTLALFAYAGLRLQPSLQKIAQSLNGLRFAEAAVTELADDVAMFDQIPPPHQEDVRPLPLADAIVFDDVTFRYAPEAPAALDGINLTLRAGESLGISGHTGGGKTTFLDLLCGLLPPTDGQIRIDGQNIDGLERRWQRGIGVVHQSSFLIDDTLRANIAFGVKADQVDDAQVTEAIRIAELQDVLDGLPDGLDTVVGERGVRLSGGQRQRVTLARAVYRQPSLLILDEGTSALDNVTEAKIIANLEALHGEMTLVMVAHRLSTIQRCDRVVFFEAGRISGLGTYDELCASNAGFQALATATA